MKQKTLFKLIILILVGFIFYSLFINDNITLNENNNNSNPGIIETNYLTFSSPNSFTLNIGDNRKYWDGTLEYSTDLNTWSEWDGTTILSAENGKLYMRGTGNTYITGYEGLPDKSAAPGRWVLIGSDISCSGNIENLLDYATVASGRHPTMADLCYNHMFDYCANLIAAPELPATTLADRCYDSMFRGCTSLTTAPELPATTLAIQCYFAMFHGCTSLTTAPELPATTLVDDCYRNMFYGCTSLITLPKLSATTLAERCYEFMFKGCTNIKLSTTQTDEYQNIYRIPSSGNGIDATDALCDMFIDTGGTFTGTPTANTTYYLHNSNTVV